MGRNACLAEKLFAFEEECCRMELVDWSVDWSIGHFIGVVNMFVLVLFQWFERVVWFTVAYKWWLFIE